MSVLIKGLLADVLILCDRWMCVGWLICFHMHILDFFLYFVYHCGYHEIFIMPPFFRLYRYSFGSGANVYDAIETNFDTWHDKCTCVKFAKVCHKILVGNGSELDKILLNGAPILLFGADDVFPTGDFDLACSNMNCAFIHNVYV